MTFTNWHDDKLFVKAYDCLLKHEGGYVDHPKDPGGATNFGISLRFYKEKINPSATPELMRRLTRDQAANIYFIFFWEPYRYHEFAEPVAIKIFDMNVNMGAKQAHKLLQRAVNECLKKQGLVVDGAMGAMTRRLAKQIDPMILLQALRKEHEKFYRALVEKRPELRIFLNGWLKRAAA